MPALRAVSKSTGNAPWHGHGSSRARKFQPGTQGGQAWRHANLLAEQVRECQTDNKAGCLIQVHELPTELSTHLTSGGP